MRLDHLKLRGFMTAFAGKDVTIDFTALPPGLIAFVGNNGEGKTTLLEAGPAGVYRQLMSREHELVDYAQDRDSCIEARWTFDDATYRARLQADGIKRSTTAVLMREGDHKPLNDGKVSTFDPAVRAIFPPVEVFKASAFGAQDKSGSFITLGKKDRRDLFASFLGADRLIRMSETASKAAAIVERKRVEVLAEIDQLSRATSAETKATLDGLARTHDDDFAVATVTRDELATAIAHDESRLATLQGQVAAYATAQQRLTGIEASMKTRLDELLHLEADHAAAGVDESNAMDRMVIDHERQVQALTDKIDDAGAGTELGELVKARAGKLADIDTKLANNVKIKEQADDIRAAVADLKAFTARLEEHRRTVTALMADERALAATIAEVERAIADYTKPKTELDRATQDSQLLETVPCGGAGEYAACQLLVNATTAKARIAELEQQIDGLTDTLKDRARHAEASIQLADRILLEQRIVASLQTDIARVAPTAKYESTLAAAEARIEELTASKVAVNTDFDRQVADAETRAAARRAELLQQKAALVESTMAREAEASARAKARAQSVAKQRTTLEAAIAGLKVDRQDAVTEIERTATAQQESSELQAQLAKDRRLREEAIAAIATAAAGQQDVARRRAELDVKTKRKSQAVAQLQALDTELVEWQLLQKALGRDGLPDLEIDQAGPGISATTNQLLSACFSSRFSVELVTQVARADGKGLKEEFTVLVTDNENGCAVRDIRDLSGGEQVIVAEALMNAVALYVHERSQTPMRTIFRDETTGPLNKDNTQRYIQMLRKVLELGGIHQILFISHDPDAFNLADAQIRIEGGKATPVLPPYREAA